MKKLRGNGYDGEEPIVALRTTALLSSLSREPLVTVTGPHWTTPGPSNTVCTLGLGQAPGDP